MVNYDHDDRVSFPGKNPEEVFQFYYHQHWLRLFFPFARFIIYNFIWVVTLIVLFVSPGTTNPGTNHLTLVGLVFIFLVIHFGFVMRFYTYFLYAVIVTDRRVHRIKKTLLLIDDHQIIDLWMLQDIKKSQHGLAQNVFHFGSLALEAQETELRLHFVPNILTVYERILHLRERARPSVPEKAERHT